MLAPSELTGGGADGAAPEASVKGEAPSSLFCPFPLVQQKQRQTSEAWVLYFYSTLSPLPPQGCKAPHLFFAPSPSGNKSKGRRAKPGCCTFFSFSPRKDLKAPHLFFTPSPSGNKSKGRRAKPGVLKFFSLLSRAGMQGPSSHFFSFLARGTKAADERSLGAVAPLLLLLLPPQGCKAPHLFFTHSPSVNKSKGRRAKPGCCRSFSFSPRKDPRPLISFLPFPSRATKAKADERSLGAVDFSPSPPAGIQGPSSLFYPSPLGQQKQRQTSEAWVL